jgi:hypothetical protein
MHQANLFEAKARLSALVQAALEVWRCGSPEPSLQDAAA